MAIETGGYYFDVHAFRGSQRVRLMDPYTRAIYRDIMDEIWLHGSIPSQPDSVATIIGWPVDEVLKSWPKIHACLTPLRADPDRLTSDRMEEERRKRNKIRRERSRVSRERWQKKRNASAMQLHNKSSDDAKQVSVSTSSSTSTSIKEKKTSASQRQKKPATDPPEVLEITEVMRNWATENGFTEADCQRETPAMLDHFRRKQERMVDWVATWRNWMRNSRKFGGVTHGKHEESREQAKVRRNIEAARDALDYVHQQASGGLGSGGHQGAFDSLPAAPLGLERGAD